MRSRLSWSANGPHPLWSRACRKLPRLCRGFLPPFNRCAYRMLVQNPLTPFNLSDSRRRRHVAAWAVADRPGDGLCFRHRSAADELRDQVRQPGFSAEYSLGSSAQPSAAAAAVSRSEPVPAILLAPGETPDSRLPAAGWRVRWTGVIEILQPGSYQFSAQATGKLSVRVGDNRLSK